MSNEYLDIAMKKVIKQEVNAVLDKIRAEIKTEEVLLMDEVMEIIDKYTK